MFVVVCSVLIFCLLCGVIDCVFVVACCVLLGVRCSFFLFVIVRCLLLLVGCVVLLCCELWVMWCLLIVVCCLL